MIDIRRGLEILKKNIRIAPEKPGVYRMLGEGGKVLYVGKAKNIKKRIVAYSHIEKLPVRLQRMVSEIERMEFIVVENEARALLLENELIKKLAPHYNILLKDDKSFPYLSLDVKAEYPVLCKYRGEKRTVTNISGRLPTPARSTTCWTFCRRRFCCVRVRTACLPTATAPV